MNTTERKSDNKIISDNDLEITKYDGEFAKVNDGEIPKEYTKKTPERTKKSSPKAKALRIDVFLWALSIILSVIPVIIKQLQYPLFIFKDMPFFYRLSSDSNFAYAFLVGSAVLITQIILTIPEYIEKRAPVIFISFGATFVLFLLFFYNSKFWYEINYEELIMNNEIVEILSYMNTMFIGLNIFISIGCVIYHSCSTNANYEN